MFPFNAFSPAPLDGPNVPQNLPDEKPRRRANPSAQSVHQTPKTVELDEGIQAWWTAWDCRSALASSCPKKKPCKFVWSRLSLTACWVGWRNPFPLILQGVPSFSCRLYTNGEVISKFTVRKKKLQDTKKVTEVYPTQNLQQTLWRKNLVRSLRRTTPRTKN